ncbi:hypothetical protein [Burkholderia orbicola]
MILSSFSVTRIPHPASRIPPLADRCRIQATDSILSFLLPLKPLNGLK